LIAQTFQIPLQEADAIIDSNASQRSRNREADIENSDRATMADEVYNRVASILGNQNAQDWFKRPKEALDGQIPLKLLETRIGTQRLLNFIDALEDGSYG
jgi:putative toxin-antitoxin system antitoxin component (TIGR02293 family)